MMMDKGMSVDEAKNFVESSGDYTDIVKLGFGTAAISRNLEKKIEVYHNADIQVYLGGTLFEAFIARDMYEDYKDLLRKLKLNMCEVSDGSINIDHAKKCEYISDLSKDFTVLSEVGSKDENISMPDKRWIELIKNELKAGSWKVITEAREGGNLGIYNDDGNVMSGLINKIIKNIPEENILWETPKKSQQVWFIKLLGPNVNLGNISSSEVIPLETLRIGLRGDTFFDYLSD